MKKGTLISFLAGLLILVGLGSFIAGREKNVDEAIAVEQPAEYIGYAEYAAVCMLKEIFPYSVYKECVRPHVQKLLVKEKVSRQEFAAFEQAVDKSLKSRGYSVRQQVLALASEESFSDSFQKNMDKFGDDASKMGKDIKKGFNNLMDDIGRQFEKDEPKPQPKSTEL